MLLCNWITLILGIIVCILLFLIIRKEFLKIRENMELSDDKLIYLKNKLLVVDPIVEKLKFSPGEKSYTINKEDVYICLKDENGDYYDENMLIYVILHEIAHAKCDEIGHTEKFKIIFNDLLKNAQKEGIYNPNIPPIQNYCLYPDKKNGGSGSNYH